MQKLIKGMLIVSSLTTSMSVLSQPGWNFPPLERPIYQTQQTPNHSVSPTAQPINNNQMPYQARYPMRPGYYPPRAAMPYSMQRMPYAQRPMPMVRQPYGPMPQPRPYMMPPANYQTPQNAYRPYNNYRPMPWNNQPNTRGINNYAYNNRRPYGGNRSKQGFFNKGPFNQGPFNRNSFSRGPFGGGNRGPFGRGNDKWNFWNNDDDDGRFGFFDMLPKEELGDIWDDMLAGPTDDGEMPGPMSWPQITVPDPFDVGDQLEEAAYEVPTFFTDGTYNKSGSSGSNRIRDYDDDDD